ncbi:MAG: class I SAM-dependent methyltransferase [Candidatus Odinarchaeota archaeon]
MTDDDNGKIQASVESTMVGPLWARATYGQQYTDLLQDRKAVEILEKVMAKHSDAKAEFKALEEFMDEFMGLNFLIRAKIFDETINAFTDNHPNATVVNIGCGLDTTFPRVDNGRITWYDLDLPEAIEYRLQFIPESSRSTCIPKSVLDHTWFDDVDFKPENGIFFFAGGLFNYFKEKEVSDLCKTMAERFPGGELMFDVPSKIGNKIINRRFRKLGVKGIVFYFGLGNPVKQISRWSDRIEVIDWFSLFSRTHRNPRWKRRTRFMMSISDLFKVGKYVHLRFK